MREETYNNKCSAFFSRNYKAEHIPDGPVGAPKGGTPNTDGGAMFGIPTANGGGIPGVGGIKPGGGIPYGGNADEKDPDAADVGAADMVPDEGGPVPDLKNRDY